MPMSGRQARCQTSNCVPPPLARWGAPATVEGATIAAAAAGGQAAAAAPEATAAAEPAEAPRKRKSRWETKEEPPSMALTTTSTGVPQEIVLAGGIKVRQPGRTRGLLHDRFDAGIIGAPELQYGIDQQASHAINCSVNSCSGVCRCTSACSTESAGGQSL